MKKKYEYIEILRIIACLMVIFNHTNERGFFRYMQVAPGSIGYFFYFALSAISKCAVPMFFMISGSLLLAKKESAGATYKRIIRVLIDIIVFTFFYVWLDDVVFGYGFNVKEILISMVHTHFWHLWFLYAYIALILTLPFFREFASGISQKGAGILYILAFALMALYPAFKQLVMPVHENLLPSWIAADIFIFPLLGYVIDNRLEIDKAGKKQIIPIVAICIAVLAIAGFSEYKMLIGDPVCEDETFLRSICIVWAPALYLLIKCIFSRCKITDFWSRAITTVGSLTFGIYLIHLVFLSKIVFFKNLWDKTGVFLSCILVFLISGIITYVLKKIPLIKKLF